MSQPETPVDAFDALIPASPPEDSASQTASSTASPARSLNSVFYVRKRIALLGPRMVGKTCLAIQCVFNKFQSEYILTIEDIFEWKTTIDGTHYDITIVDTDGQDANTYFGLQYTIGVDGYILVFSVRDRQSFELVKAINDKLLSNLNVLYRKGTWEVPRILVGNQIDMPDRQVDYEIAQRYAEEQGIPYFETSACSSYNVANVFQRLISIVQSNVYTPTLPSSEPPPPSHVHQQHQHQHQHAPNNFCLIQ